MGQLYSIRSFLSNNLGVVQKCLSQNTDTHKPPRGRDIGHFLNSLILGVNYLFLALLRYRMAGITESAMAAYTHKYAVV